MSNTKFVRTTITLPEDLLFEIKKQALMERKSMKKIIHERLRKPATSLYGIWGKGASGLETLKEVRYGDKKQTKKKDLVLLAQMFVGAGKWRKNHPVWKDKTHTDRWLQSIRSEWDRT